MMEDDENSLLGMMLDVMRREKMLAIVECDEEAESRKDGKCFIYISSTIFYKYHPCKANVVLGHPALLLLRPAHLLPVRKYSLDQRPCLFVCMLLQPSDVFGFLPSMQFVGKRYRRTYDDMVEHNQRRKALRSLWLCQERVVEEQQWSTRPK